MLPPSEICNLRICENMQNEINMRFDLMLNRQLQNMENKKELRFNNNNNNKVQEKLSLFFN
jgi:hypothetical protein